MEEKQGEKISLESTINVTEQTEEKQFETKNPDLNAPKEVNIFKIDKLVRVMSSIETLQRSLQNICSSHSCIQYIAMKVFFTTI